MKWLINFVIFSYTFGETADNILYQPIKKLISFLGDYVSINTNKLALIFFKLGVILCPITIFILDNYVNRESKVTILIDIVVFLFMALTCSVEGYELLKSIIDSDDSSIVRVSKTRSFRVQTLSYMFRQPFFVLLFVLVEMIFLPSVGDLIKVFSNVVVSVYIMYIMEYLAFVIVDHPPTKRKKLSFVSGEYASNGV